MLLLLLVTKKDHSLNCGPWWSIWDSILICGFSQGRL